jgi:hypothetical protein
VSVADSVAIALPGNLTGTSLLSARGDAAHVLAEIHEARV